MFSVFLPIAVLFSPMAVVFLPMFSVFLPIAVLFAAISPAFFAISVAFFVTLSLNACAKPTVTVGASSAPPTVTVVSPAVPRNLTLLFLSFPRLTAFVLVPSVTLNFAEILVTAVSPLLIFPTSCLLFTPYLMVAPFLATVSPWPASTSKVTSLSVLLIVFPAFSASLSEAALSTQEFILFFTVVLLSIWSLICVFSLVSFMPSFRPSLPTVAVM